MKLYTVPQAARELGLRAHGSILRHWARSGLVVEVAGRRYLVQVGLKLGSRWVFPESHVELIRRFRRGPGHPRSYVGSPMQVMQAEEFWKIYGKEVIKHGDAGG